MPGPGTSSRTWTRNAGLASRWCSRTTSAAVIAVKLCKCLSCSSTWRCQVAWALRLRYRSVVFIFVQTRVRGCRERTASYVATTSVGDAVTGQAPPHCARSGDLDLDLGKQPSLEKVDDCLTHRGCFGVAVAEHLPSPKQSLPSFPGWMDFGSEPIRQCAHSSRCRLNSPPSAGQRDRRTTLRPRGTDIRNGPA